MAAIDVEVLIGHEHSNREYNVSLLDDGTFIFNWTNGDEMTDEETATYCREINGAKAHIEARIQFRQLGNGLPIYSVSDSDSTKVGIYSHPSNRSEMPTVYTYPGSRTTSEDGPCKVDNKSNLVKPIKIL